MQIRIPIVGPRVLLMLVFEPIFIPHICLLDMYMLAMYMMTMDVLLSCMLHDMLLAWMLELKFHSACAANKWSCTQTSIEGTSFEGTSFKAQILQSQSSRPKKNQQHWFCSLNRTGKTMRQVCGRAEWLWDVWIIEYWDHGWWNIGIREYWDHGMSKSWDIEIKLGLATDSLACPSLRISVCHLSWALKAKP